MTKTKLISQGPGHWESEDDRVLITLDETFETECDAPHPVRLSLNTLDSFSDWFKRGILARGTVKGKYVTYQCEGNETHHYSQWTVRVDDEWTHDVYDTFAQARAAAERLVGPTVLVRRKAAPKTRETTINPVTGAATWVACGHRAELDINEDCYTCHQDPAR